MKKNKIIQSVKVLILGLIFSFGANYVFAAPIILNPIPPQNNVTGPINVGTSTQIKNGDLSVNGFLVTLNAAFLGNVGIGTADPISTLHVSGNALFKTSPNSSNTSAAEIRGGDGYSTATDPDYTFNDDNSTGMFHPADHTLAFSASGGTGIKIDPDANVFFGGNTSPVGFTNSGMLTYNIYKKAGDLKYVNSGYGSFVKMNNGSLEFAIAPNGSAGSTAGAIKKFGISSTGIMSPTLAHVGGSNLCSDASGNIITCAGSWQFGGTYTVYSVTFPGHNAGDCDIGNPLNGGSCACPSGFSSYTMAQYTKYVTGNYIPFTLKGCYK